MMEFKRYIYLFICVILDTVASQCEFPSNLRGDWLRSRDEKILTFSSTTVVGFNFQSKSQTVDNFSCFIKDGSRYILRSERYLNIAPGTFIYIYLCYDMVPVADKSFYIYELTEESSEIMNNERGAVISDTIQVSVSDVCTITRNDVQYTTLVQNAALSQTVSYCPEILLGAFNYSQTSLSGCIGNSNLTACVDQYGVNAQSVGCPNEYFGYSSDGNLLCTTHLMFSTITYVTLYNKDTTVDNTNTYRFTCLAIEENNGLLMVTQHPKDCTLGQTGTSVPSPGFSFSLQASVLCPLPVEAATVEDNIPLIVGVLVGVIILLIIIIIIILIIRGKKSRQKQKIHQYPENPPISELKSSTKKQQSTVHSEVEFSPVNSASSNNSTIPLASSGVTFQDKQNDLSVKESNGVMSTPSPKTPHQVFVDADGNPNYSVTTTQGADRESVVKVSNDSFKSSNPLAGSNSPNSKTSQQGNNKTNLENSREHKKDITEHQGKSEENVDGVVSSVNSPESAKKSSSKSCKSVEATATPTHELEARDRPNQQSTQQNLQSSEPILQVGKSTDTTGKSREPVNLTDQKSKPPNNNTSEGSKIRQNQQSTNGEKTTNGIVQNSPSEVSSETRSLEPSASNRGIFATFSSIFRKDSKSEKPATSFDQTNPKADAGHASNEEKKEKVTTSRTKNHEPLYTDLPKDSKANLDREGHANIRRDTTNDVKTPTKGTFDTNSLLIKPSTIFKRNTKNNSNEKNNKSQKSGKSKLQPRNSSKEKAKQRTPEEVQSSPFPENSSGNSDDNMRGQRVSVISSIGPLSSELAPSRKVSVVSVSPSPHSSKHDPNSSKYNDEKHLQNPCQDKSNSNAKKAPKKKKKKK